MDPHPHEVVHTANQLSCFKTGSRNEESDEIYRSIIPVYPESFKKNDITLKRPWMSLQFFLQRKA